MGRQRSRPRRRTGHSLSSGLEKKITTNKKINKIEIMKSTSKINENRNIDFLEHPEKYFYPKDYSQTKLEQSYPTPEGIKIISYGYAKPEDIKGWEHNEIHTIPSSELEDYSYNIPPVLISQNGQLIDDGNHRVNTLKHYNKDVPVIVVSNPPRNYNLRYSEELGLFLIDKDYPKNMIIRNSDIPKNRIIKGKK